MALDPRQQAEYNRLVQEGISLADKLGDSISRANFQQLPNAAQATADQLRNLTTSVAGLNQEWRDLTRDVAGAAESFNSMVEDIKKMGTGVGRTTSAFNKLSGIASKVSQIQQGTLDIDKKGLLSLKEKLKNQVTELQLAEKILQRNAADLVAGRQLNDLTEGELRQYNKIQSALTNIQGELRDGVKNHQAVNDAIDDQVDLLQKAEDGMGLLGTGAKALGSALDAVGLGPLNNYLKLSETSAQVMKDMKERLTEVNEETGEITYRSATMGDKLWGAGKMAKGLGANLTAAATDPLVVFGKVFNMLQKAGESTANLARGMNFTYKEAINVRKELGDIAGLSGDPAINTERLQKSLMTVGNALGSNAKLNEADLKTFTKLTEQAKISEQAALGLQKVSLATGKSLEDNTKEFLAQAKITSTNNGVVLNEKQLLEEVANVSADIKASTGLTGKGLAEAAAQAKAFGMSLDQVNKIAGTLLNFETSIQNELEAELLTGKQLNLEKAREAALNNDLTTLTQELRKNYGDISDFQNMNRIQQEAIAKSVGMSREELAASLLEEKALRGLSGQAAEDAKKAYDRRVEEVGLAQAQRELEEGGIENLMQQQSNTERLQQAMQKFSDVIVNNVLPPLQLIGEFLASAFEMISLITYPVQLLSKFMYSIGDAIGSWLAKLGPVGKILKGIAGTAIVYAAYKAYGGIMGTLGQLIGPFAIPVAAAAAAGIASAGFGMLNAQKVEDGIAPSEKGPFTITDKFGKTAITAKGDSVAVSPNVTKEGSSNSGVDMTPVLDAINRLISVVESGGTVTLDGQAVGKALKLSTYSTGR